MANAPIVSWYEGTNTLSGEVKTTINYGTVDADSQSPTKVFYIWNNRAGDEDCSKMEEVTFTTRDRAGGLGDAPIVEAVRDNWFNIRVDSLSETTFTPVGKGGIGTVNPSGVKDLGTSGVTINKNAANALVWSGSTSYSLGDYVQPVTSNGFIYKVTKAGISDTFEPTWATVEANPVFDGTVEFESVKIENTPASKEILGFANKTLEDGSNATLAGGNFVQVSVYAEVPISASAGRNLLMQRVSYRYV